MLLRLLRLAAGALVPAILAGRLGLYDPWLDLFSHFAWHFTLAALGLALAFALHGRLRWTLAMFAAAGVAAWPLLNVGSRGQPISGGPPEELVLVQFNANHRNRQLGPFVQAVLDREPRPNIVVVQEVNDAVLAQLAPLQAAYPYHLARPEPGAYGMALYSNLRPTAQERAPFPGGTNHYTMVQLLTPQGVPLNLIELHAASPLGRDSARRRNAELQFVAELGFRSWRGYHLSELGFRTWTSTLIVGDLNVTPASPWFAQLEEKSRMHSRLNLPRPMGTWPSWLPMRLALPIDHVLASRDMAIEGQRIGPSFGSDHHMVTTRFTVFGDR